MDELLDEEAACAFLKITDRQLRRLRESRQLGYVKLGKTPRYTLTMLQEYVESHTREALR